ncbi:MAG: glycosyltransferase family 2 protein, partial [Clostridia bacterium]|nr:glycosyltransferase family 2 protein [Clostridia bacterium]
MKDYDREASIIIPTYNRAELLEFTLLSLYKQSIPANTFEVIVVNDGSTDQTPTVLSKIQPPYNLVALHNKTNRGAAYSRNKGIQSSRGKIIIFLDEMLVDKNFIKNHLKYHVQEDMVVTTHYNGQKIFSHYYPNFSLRQKQKFKKHSGKLNSINNKKYKKGVLRLFSKQDVINHSILRYGFRDGSRPKWFRSFQAAYGKYLEEMATPWFLFITNGVSVPRKLLENAGLFDEKLKTWMEDWELGYRLYLAGAKFYNASEIACYH